MIVLCSRCELEATCDLSTCKAPTERESTSGHAKPCVFTLQDEYLGHFQVGSYRYRSLIEGIYTF